MCNEVEPKYTTSHLFTEAPRAKFLKTDRMDRIDQGSESPSKTFKAAVMPFEEHIKPVDDVPVAMSRGCVPKTSHKNWSWFLCVESPMKAIVASMFSSPSGP